MGDWADEPQWDEFDDELSNPCPTCMGTGTVNPLTNPSWAPFVASFGYCPVCDGTGEAQ